MLTEYTASVCAVGSDQMRISFNAMASDNIHGNEYVIIIGVDKIVLREPTLSDSKIKKLRKRKIGNVKDILIGSCYNKDLYYGLYNVEIDDYEIILTKRSK